MKVATINGITIQGDTALEFLKDWDSQKPDSPRWEQQLVRMVWQFMKVRNHPSSTAHWQANGDEFHVSYP